MKIFPIELRYFSAISVMMLLHVRDAGLKGASDDAVIGYARKHGYVLITVDRDFGNMLDYTPGTHPGIIRLKIRYMPAGMVNTLLRDLFEKVAFEEISGNLVIVEEGRYASGRKWRMSDSGEHNGVGTVPPLTKGRSGGVAQITSAFPVLYPWRVVIAVSLILFMVIMNLRGVKESGRIFAVPTYFFLGMVILTIGMGFFQYINGPLGKVVDVKEVAHMGEAHQPLTIFLILRRL